MKQMTQKQMVSIEAKNKHCKATQKISSMVMLQPTCSSLQNLIDSKFSWNTINF